MAKEINRINTNLSNSDTKNNKLVNLSQSFNTLKDSTNNLKTLFKKISPSSSNSNIKQFMNYGQNTYNLIFFLFFIIFIIIYITKKLTKNENNCEIIKKSFNNEQINFRGFNSINDLNTLNYFEGKIGNKIYNYKLKDFYIKTAYNCFCNGNFRNDYVNECALVNCAKNGVRALDMQIYSLKNIPIISASSVNINSYKETYNNISFENAISKIDSVYYQNGYFDNEQKIKNNLINDPLFLILRLHYGNDNTDFNSSVKEKNQLRFYNKIYNILVEQFSEEKFAIVNLKTNFTQSGKPLDKVYEIKNMKMSETKDKIFLFVILNDEPNYNIIKSSNLDNIVSLYGTDFTQFRYNELNAGSGLNLITTYETQNQITYCMPSFSSYNNNYDFTLPLKYGTQFIGMNFQNLDGNLNNYNKFFQQALYNNNKTSPYVKKPDHMIQFGTQIFS